MRSARASCARAARRRFRSPITRIVSTSRRSGQGERGSGQFVDITWDEAIKELTGKLNELAAANDQASLALLTKPRRGRRLELIAELLQCIWCEAAR